VADLLEDRPRIARRLARISRTKACFALASIARENIHALCCRRAARCAKMRPDVARVSRLGRNPLRPTCADDFIARISPTRSGTPGSRRHPPVARIHDDNENSTKTGKRRPRFIPSITRYETFGKVSIPLQSGCRRETLQIGRNRVFRPLRRPANQLQGLGRAIGERIKARAGLQQPGAARRDHQTSVKT